MNAVLAQWMLVGLSAATPPGSELQSYVYQPAFALDKVLRLPASPYCPQPGDIILAANNDIRSVIGHILAGSGYPNHSMIVFARPDGTLAILEAGPHGALKEGVSIVELWPHLCKYEAAGRLWVRARTTPLTAEESARLTEFVYLQAGKKFPKFRVYAQVTPLRSKIPLAAALRGRPDYDKSAYFCSELVMNACCYAGLIDADHARPSATYPRDIFYGRTRNLFVNRSLKEMNCGWAPPARWTQSPVLMQTEPAAPIKIAR